MKKLIAFGICLAGCAVGQTKVSATGKCTAKPEVSQAVEVGDRAGHMMIITKQTCVWTAPMEMAGVKAKDYTVTVVSDSMGGKSQDRGYVVVTMENGDKAFVRIN